MGIVAMGEWITRTMRKYESDDKWLRTGVRILTLLVLCFAILVSGAALESLICGDVSGITRLAWFIYLVGSIPAILFGSTCVAAGFLRKYIFKRRQVSN